MSEQINFSLLEQMLSDGLYEVLQQELMALLSESKRKQDRMKLETLLSVVYGCLAKYSLALTYSQAAYDKAEQLKDVTAMMTIATDQIMMYGRVKEFEQAQNVANQALDYAKQLKDMKQLTRIYSDLAMLYAEKKPVQHERVLSYLRLANQLPYETNPSFYLNVNLNIAMYEFLLMNYQKTHQILDTLQPKVEALHEVVHTCRYVRLHALVLYATEQQALFEVEQVKVEKLSSFLNDVHAQQNYYYFLVREAKRLNREQDVTLFTMKYQQLTDQLNHAMN